MDEMIEESMNEFQNIDFMRYFKTLVRRWWLICLITMGVTVPWILYIKHQSPQYEARALIGFENLTGTVPKNLVQSRITKLKSRSFAEEVTASKYF
jgi:uncharacterized protein involved in exopolysaccharide biosynthesis